MAVLIVTAGRKYDIVKIGARVPPRSQRLACDRSPLGGKV